MREALYDVATGSAQAMPDHDGDRIIVVPTRRLRPVGTARADRRARHGTSSTRDLMVQVMEPVSRLRSLLSRGCYVLL